MVSKPHSDKALMSKLNPVVPAQFADVRPLPDCNDARLRMNSGDGNYE